jgi:hypothetical protein
MSYAISFSSGFSVLTVDGECKPKDVEETLSLIINNPNPDVNKSLLIDVRQVTNAATTTEIHEFINIYKSVPFKRIAITVNDPAHYGMARMFAAYSEANKQEVFVFYDIDEARIWLSNSS